MAQQGMNGNKQAGTSAEKYVAEELFGGIRTPNEWYDVETPDGIHEVKSTIETLSSGRNGRFRLWKDQHEKLLEEGGTYHFLVDGVGYETLAAEAVEQVIQESGVRWTTAGEHRSGRKQLKLRWPEIFPDEG